MMMDFKFRDDGFPLCPRCGLDELVSTVMLHWDGKGERPFIQDLLNNSFLCYNCDFTCNSFIELVNSDTLLLWMETHGLETNLRQGNFKQWHCSWIYRGTFQAGFGSTPREAIFDALK